jgi:hypothetical protein
MDESGKSFNIKLVTIELTIIRVKNRSAYIARYDPDQGAFAWFV